ncbi:DUF6783 domain-containing protein [uncultured Robinsoniella sp.]|uniref:DUF6783 domain-containing protein n=1 Tax=uncultured Robinsoniella sp. TaxID=904190 RepID=UPI00374ED665
MFYITFSQLCVPVCGRFVTVEGRIAGYVTRLTCKTKEKCYFHSQKSGSITSLFKLRCFNRKSCFSQYCMPHRNKFLPMFHPICVTYPS